MHPAPAQRSLLPFAALNAGIEELEARAVLLAGLGDSGGAGGTGDGAEISGAFCARAAVLQVPGRSNFDNILQDLQFKI